jgi:hypothetical protein
MAGSKPCQNWQRAIAVTAFFRAACLSITSSILEKFQAIFSKKFSHPLLRFFIDIADEMDYMRRFNSTYFVALYLRDAATRSLTMPS